jgi:hypothetical protein
MRDLAKFAASNRFTIAFLYHPNRLRKGEDPVVPDRDHFGNGGATEKEEGQETGGEECTAIHFGTDLKGN